MEYKNKIYNWPVYAEEFAKFFANAFKKDARNTFGIAEDNEISSSIAQRYFTELRARSKQGREYTSNAFANSANFQNDSFFENAMLTVTNDYLDSKLEQMINADEKLLHSYQRISKNINKNSKISVRLARYQTFVQQKLGDNPRALDEFIALNQEQFDSWVQNNLMSQSVKRNERNYEYSETEQKLGFFVYSYNFAPEEATDLKAYAQEIEQKINQAKATAREIQTQEDLVTFANAEYAQYCELRNKAFNDWCKQNDMDAAEVASKIEFYKTELKENQNFAYFDIISSINKTLKPAWITDYLQNHQSEYDAFKSKLGKKLGKQEKDLLPKDESDKETVIRGMFFEDIRQKDASIFNLNSQPNVNNNSESPVQNQEQEHNTPEQNQEQENHAPEQAQEEENESSEENQVPENDTPEQNQEPKSDGPEPVNEANSSNVVFQRDYAKLREMLKAHFDNFAKIPDTARRVETLKDGFNEIARTYYTEDLRTALFDGNDSLVENFIKGDKISTLDFASYDMATLSEEQRKYINETANSRVENDIRVLTDITDKLGEYVSQGNNIQSIVTDNSNQFSDQEKAVVNSFLTYGEINITEQNGQYKTEFVINDKFAQKDANGDVVKNSEGQVTFDPVKICKFCTCFGAINKTAKLLSGRTQQNTQEVVRNAVPAGTFTPSFTSSEEMGKSFERIMNLWNALPNEKVATSQLNGNNTAPANEDVNTSSPNNKQYVTPEIEIINNVQVNEEPEVEQEQIIDEEPPVPPVDINKPEEPEKLDNVVKFDDTVLNLAVDLSYGISLTRAKNWLICSRHLLDVSANMPEEEVQKLQEEVKQAEDLVKKLTICVAEKDENKRNNARHEVLSEIGVYEYNLDFADDEIRKNIVDKNYKQEDDLMLEIAKKAYEQYGAIEQFYKDGVLLSPNQIIQLISTIDNELADKFKEVRGVGTQIIDPTHVEDNFK